MVLDIYDAMDAKTNYYVDFEIRDLFNSLSSAILYPVKDPNGIQGDINYFSWEDIKKISSALKSAYEKAKNASENEFSDSKASINMWREIFGNSFPEFTED